MPGTWALSGPGMRLWPSVVEALDIQAVLEAGLNGLPAYTMHKTPHEARTPDRPQSLVIDSIPTPRPIPSLKRIQPASRRNGSIFACPLWGFLQ